jgi:phosphoribosyl 1,2-cyclic phosphodiesterase
MIDGKGSTNVPISGYLHQSFEFDSRPMEGLIDTILFNKSLAKLPQVGSLVQCTVLTHGHAGQLPGSPRA